MENSASTLQQRLVLAVEAAPNNPSQADISRACGISPVSVSAWFKGKTKSLGYANLSKAANYLGVSPEWLAGLSPNMRNHVPRDKYVGTCPVDFSKVANFAGDGGKDKHCSETKIIFQRVTLNHVIKLGDSLNDINIHRYFTDTGELLLTRHVHAMHDDICPF